MPTSRNPTNTSSDFQSFCLYPLLPSTASTPRSQVQQGSSSAYSSFLSSLTPSFSPCHITLSSDPCVPPDRLAAEGCLLQVSFPQTPLQM